MRFYRVGDKVISRDKLVDMVSDILAERESGATQEESARHHGVQRTFVSFLESLGEVRRGKRVAIIGFPVANTDEVKALAEKHAVEFVLVYSQAERELLEAAPADRVFNMVLETLAKLADFDVIIILASDWRVELVEKILGREVIGINLGHSPLRHDVAVDIDALDALLTGITESDGAKTRAQVPDGAADAAGRWERSSRS